jgi:hypothetical protein
VLPVSRWALAAFVLVLAAPSGAPSRSLGGGERAFVAAAGDDLLVAVNLDSPPGQPRVVARMRMPRGPRSVSNAVSVRVPGPTPLDAYLLVTSPPSGSVTLVAAFRPRLLKVFRGLEYPFDAEIVGDFAYVTEERAGRVAVLDLERRRIVGKLVVGPGPRNLAGHSGGPVWVTHGRQPRHLTALDISRPSSPRVVRRIALPAAPRDVTVACNGRRVWATYWNTGTVTVLNARSGTRLFERRAGTSVQHIQVDGIGRDVWTTDRVDNRTRLFDGCNGRLLRTLRMGARQVAMGHFAGHVVVTSRNRVRVFRRQCECVRTLRVGRGLQGVTVAGVP